MNQSDTKVWIEYAESDLHAAHTLFESKESFPLQICFLSQQCAEKAIKAILVVESRYPGEMPNVTEREASEALRLALSAFDAISAELHERMQQNLE